MPTKNTERLGCCPYDLAIQFIFGMPEIIWGWEFDSFGPIYLRKETKSMYKSQRSWIMRLPARIPNLPFPRRRNWLQSWELMRIRKSEKIIFFKFLSPIEGSHFSNLYPQSRGHNFQICIPNRGVTRGFQPENEDWGDPDSERCSFPRSEKSTPTELCAPSLSFWKTASKSFQTKSNIFFGNRCIYLS